MQWSSVYIESVLRKDSCLTLPPTRYITSRCPSKFLCAFSQSASLLHWKQPMEGIPAPSLNLRVSYVKEVSLNLGFPF